MKLLSTIVACIHGDDRGMNPSIPRLADGSYPFVLRLIYTDLIATDTPPAIPDSADTQQVGTLLIQLTDYIALRPVAEVRIPRLCIVDEDTHSIRDIVEQEGMSLSLESQDQLQQVEIHPLGPWDHGEAITRLAPQLIAGQLLVVGEVMQGIYGVIGILQYELDGLSLRQIVVQLYIHAWELISIARHRRLLLGYSESHAGEQAEGTEE